MNNIVRPFAGAAAKGLRAGPTSVRSTTPPKSIQRRAFRSCGSGFKPGSNEHKVPLMDRILEGVVITMGVTCMGLAGAVTYDITCDVLHRRRQQRKDDLTFEKPKAFMDNALAQIFGHDTVESLRENLNNTKVKLDDAKVMLKDAQIIKQNQVNLLAWVELLLEEKVAGLESKIQELQAQQNENSCAVKKDMKYRLSKTQSQEKGSSWINWRTIPACTVVLAVGQWLDQLNL